MGEQIEDDLFVIQDLYNLVNPQIPCDQSKIVKVNYSRLQYVDQYGCNFVKLTIELVNTSTGENWTMFAIAKKLPKYCVSQDMSFVRTVFKNQVGIYTTTRKAIDNFLKEKGMKTGEDFFVNSIGGRINLNGSTEIDHNAVLIIVDLLFRGYKMVHCRTGFDLDTSKAILMALTKLHASTLGLKLTNPKEFREKIRPYLGKFWTAIEFEEIARNHMIKVLKNQEFSLGIIDRALATFDRKHFEEIREPWATFTHTNLSVKNVLVKFDRRKVLIDVKLKGFQESEYSSPLRDLIFFLFSSVQLVVLKEHLDELIDFYYENLLRLLTMFEVDTRPFSRTSFNEELNACASTDEFYKTVCNLYLILGSKREIQNDFNDNNCGASELKDPLHIRKLCYIVREFDKRNWIHL